MAKKTECAVVIDAPMDLVWDMTNDVPNWPDLFTEYAAAEVLERDGNTIRFRLTMHPDENGRVNTWVSERTSDPATRTVRAHRIETGPFDFMNIFWAYREVDGGVEMRWEQEFHVKDEMPFDDDAMAAHLLKNSAIQMAAIKERIEKAAVARS
ncbi:SRPBCC family protein [Micromonospora sagamiensis]|uniref:Aromatase n=1 Tax=Micromonospora sagamiensis TaxID=47875 RepID=A0A562WIU8_9ACTN|nr:SRPBCC family protein [Micromonospora sagamiensis]TWJ30213.1 aromatase [Micromonospora sagamiensis]BCL16757.1 putative polyketide cyclase [Micromonospora sagamiensis]